MQWNSSGGRWQIRKKPQVFQEFCTFCTGFCTVCPVQRIFAYSAWLVYITLYQEFLRIVQYFSEPYPATIRSHCGESCRFCCPPNLSSSGHFPGRKDVFLKNFCKKRKKLLILRHLPAIIYFCMKKNTRFYIPSP